MSNNADNLLTITRHGPVGSFTSGPNAPSNSELVKLQGGSNVPRPEPFIKGTTPDSGGPSHGNGNVTPGELSGDVVNVNLDLVKESGGGDGVLTRRQQRLATYQAGAAKYKAGVRSWWQNFLNPAPVKRKPSTVRRK